MNKMKKLLSSLLALSMVLSYVPMPAVAEEVCTHHVHDDQCGYSEGAPCTFDHAASCQYETVVVSCSHNHGEDGCTYAAAQAAVFCHPIHTEECGYVPGVDCTCGVTEGDHLAGCAYVAEVPCNVTHEGCGCREAIPESGKCNHVCMAESGCELTVNHVCGHTACDETCGFEAAAECTFVCTECKAEEKTCTCESTDPGEHAPFCDLYVRIYEECKCVLSCAEEGLNDYCETCWFEGVDACGGGEEEAIVFTDFVISSNGRLTQYNGSDAHVEIPANVTSIDTYAFDGCSSLESVTIPGPVTTIMNYAFRGCTNLRSVTIQGSGTTIMNYAFQGCTNLRSVTISGSVEKINSNAFNDCSSLESVTIPGSVTTIMNNAFRDCTNLQSVTIPGSVTTIMNFAFQGCTNLRSVTISGSVEKINSYAFNDCSSLESVTISGSVMTIDNNAFSGSTGQPTVNVPCNWEDSLYNFGDNVNVKKADHSFGTDGKCTVCNACQHNFGNQDTCTCGVKAKAKVQDDDTITYYETLQKALDSAHANGGTVHALADYADSFNIALDVPFNGGDFTFAGNITNDGTIQGGSFSGTITNLGTIQGGSFAGKLVNEGTVKNHTSIQVGPGFQYVQQGNGVVEGDHNGIATCLNKAVCSFCGEYGERKDHNWVDGFCTNGCNAEHYNLWVGGVAITSGNTAGTGWSYDRGSKTLTLTDAAITGSYNESVIYSTESLNLKLEGSNTVSGDNYGIQLTGTGSEMLIISGSGTLNVTGYFNAIKGDNAHVTISGGVINGTGTVSTGIAANSITLNDGMITIHGATTGNGLDGIISLAPQVHLKVSHDQGAVNGVLHSANGWSRTSESGDFTGTITAEGTYFEYLGKDHVTICESAADSAVHSISCTHGVNFDEAHTANDYTVSGDTISAKCAVCQKPQGSWTITAPENAVYDGQAKIATVIGSITGVTPVITYTKDSETISGNPVDAGTYTASVTVDTDKAISVTYTIATRNITIKANDQIITYGSNLTEKAVTISGADGFGGAGGTGSALASGDTLDSVTLTPSTTKVTNDGKITSSNAVIKDGNNDVTANYSITYKEGKLTISRKSLTAADVTAALSDNLIFEGAPIPTLTVKDGDITLIKDTDYTVTQTGNEGLFTLTIEGKGNYKDTWSGTLTYLVVTLPDPNKVEPDDKNVIDAYDRYSKLNETYKDAELTKSLEELKEALTAYDVTIGHKSSYTKGSGKTFTITANGYFGKFTGLKIDGKILDSKYYTAKSGSTIVTLKNSYLDSLSDGKHTVEFLYTDGSTGGDHYFRISTNNGSPFTGDNNHIMMFSGIMMTSLLCMAMMIMFVPRKKGKYQR